MFYSDSIKISPRSVVLDDSSLVYQQRLLNNEVNLFNVSIARDRQTGIQRLTLTDRQTDRQM